MTVQLFLFVSAAICFAVQAVRNRDLIAAGFCLITIALWIV